MIYIFFGGDSFSIHEAVKDLKARLDSDGMLESNTTVLSAQQITPDQLVAVCDTVPFLASVRLVVVEGLLGRLEASGGRRRDRRSKKSGAAANVLGPWEILPEYALRMPASTHLLLVDDDISPENPLLAALSSQAQARRFQPLHLKRELPGWIKSRAEQLSLALTEDAVRLLVDLVGNNLWLLASELEKLAVYAEARRIDAGEVRSLVGASREYNIFPVVDAVIEGRAEQAIRLLHDELALGASREYALAMLVRQYRLLVQTRDMLDNGVAASEIRNALGVWSDFAFQKLLQQAQRYSLSQLKAAYLRLLEADASVKLGISDEGAALDTLLSDLAALSKGAFASSKSG
ncbi:MAG TPA: DNA polymerase III subunit delta [Dehalococcoidia bacterium]|nr:DNA polymerase III subunit delta [Dehalococcoidia bacterium]